MVTGKEDMSFWKELRDLCLDPTAREYDVVRVSDALMRIIAVIGDEHLPDSVADAVDRGGFTADEGALLIGVAGYSTPDEGARIQSVLEQWLEANADETRIGMALAHGTVPFRVPSHRAEVLGAVASRFPRFADKCKYLVETYKNVRGTNGA
jgi:hypothetical protein